ncbi:MAG TPA: MFS transporter [Alphaproteobacteria bacterium]|nr:MFS transporter [Alphaproteobacteria bacterium]
MSTPSPAITLRSWMVLISIGVLIFLINIDYTAVNLTLVPIAEEIKADLNSLQWLLSGYVLVWAAFVIPAGRVADFYGKRNTLIAGLTLFMAGSCLTGFGHSLEMLIFGRVLQGLGAAIFSAPAWAVIFTTASPEKQGFVMGVILSFSGFGLAAGPTLAGFIIQEASWRWIFYINIPLGLLVIAILQLYGQKDILLNVKQKIDYISTFLLATGLCIFVYTLNDIEILGIKSFRIWGGLGLGVLLIGSCFLRDRTQKIRMIPPHLFHNKAYMAASVGEFFMAINFSLVLVMMGLYLQNTLNYSSYETGLIFISMTISMGLLSPIGGKMIDTLGIKGPMIFGSLLTAVALGMMAFLQANSSLYYVITVLFLAGTGLGAYFTACNTAMMRAVPDEDLNVASGVFMMLMMVGNTLSIILSTSFVVLFGRSYLLQNAQQHGLILSSQQQQNLVEVISKVEHSASQLKDFPSEQIPQLLSWINEAFVYGLSLNMMFGCLFALIATGLTIWGIEAFKSSASHKHVPIAI